MRILLTGGAGYVGSACFRHFRRQGIEAFVLDDLSEGHAGAVEADRLDVADIRDTDAVAAILRRRGIDHVVHLAALISVPDSITDPAGYWSVNTAGSMSLLEAMRAEGVGRIVFSSTAAVYAHGFDRPIREDDPIAPATPYGASKLAVEHLLEGYATGYGMAATALRYFNAAGADLDGRHGEAHRRESHAIPLVVEAALGNRAGFDVYGGEWDTPDGSCIRDFVSVIDLADAHLRALKRARPGVMARYNLGSGTGTSVREILAAAEAVTGRPVPSQVKPARPGDPARLIADTTRARTELGWTPRHSDAQSLLSAAIAWHGSYGLDHYLGTRIAAE
ncbi:UDP-glucose 4-epimerase [Palleronia aestuarii]|uniref:UDP-glucose 4-epimerase n=1 Tax=Palleronia aestuarii TaxID=568105 RepID=A0A2W7NK99_9RHOB|nr:UDP-glucose 4-epimerase GalE [Palleronia aestuarii]PZX17124.1 UDP-glucose 4-epimerase [Palleronia aestuarii]